MIDIFRNGACRFDANGNILAGITQLPVTHLMVGTAVVYHGYDLSKFNDRRFYSTPGSVSHPPSHPHTPIQRKHSAILPKARVMFSHSKETFQKEKVWHYRMLPFRVLYRRVGFFPEASSLPSSPASRFISPYSLLLTLHPSRIFSPQALYPKNPPPSPFCFQRGNEHRQSAFRLSPYVFRRWMPDKQCRGESPS
jgi:hypothetical protein